jgi:hypothetical protein
VSASAAGAAPSRAVKILAVMVGLLGGLALVETLPRLAPQLMPGPLRAIDRLYSAREAWQGMMQGDRQLGFVLRPGLDLQFPSEGRQIHVRTVSPGVAGISYRDLGTQPPFDAIAIGDSFTFCDDVPVEACWVRHLGEATGLSVATLGVNGYSTLAEARLLERVGPQLSPRLVLLGVFPNDFKDNVYFDRWTHTGTDDYWLWMRRRQRSDFVEALTRHSVVYQMIDGARRYGSRRTYHHQEGGLDFVFRGDDWWQQVLEAPEDAPGWGLMQGALREMQRSATAMGAQLVVLLFPFKEQVYWDIVRRYQPDLATVDVEAPLTMVSRFCEREGIIACDLLGPLRAEAGRGRQLYHSVSAHWNDAGNTVAAQAVAACLARRGLMAPAGTHAALSAGPRN